MQIQYDTETDSKYIKLVSHKKIVRTKETEDCLMIDYDENNTVVGIEVLRISQRPPVGLYIADNQVECYPLISSITEEKKTEECRGEISYGDRTDELNLSIVGVIPA